MEASIREASEVTVLCGTAGANHWYTDSRCFRQQLLPRRGQARNKGTDAPRSLFSAPETIFSAQRRVSLNVMIRGLTGAQKRPEGILLNVMASGQATAPPASCARKPELRIADSCRGL